MPALQSAFADGEGSGMGEKCRVDVIRGAAPGSAEVTRQVLDNGGCVCTVQAGPIDNNGAAEGIVSALLRDRECDGAPDTPADHAASAGAGGGIPGAGLVMGGAAMAGLGLAAAGGGGNDSRG